MTDYIILGLVIAAALGCWYWSDKAAKAQRDLEVARAELRILSADVRALAQRNQERLGRIVDAANAIRPFASGTWTAEQAEEYRVAMIRLCEAQLVRGLTDLMEPKP